MRTLIFDLDGTLADTSADMIAAANRCFAALGLGAMLDPELDGAIAFRGGRAMLSAGFARAADAGGPDFGAGEIDSQYPLLLEAYGGALCEHTRPYPGAIEAVERALARGDKVGICTNKPVDLAERLLEAMGVRPLFGSVVGAGTLAMRKPHPEPLRSAVCRAGGDPARACLIGDTVTDRDTARAAGMPCVLVGFGPGAAEAAALAPDALLAHFDELDAVIERLLGPGGEPARPGGG